MAGLKVVSLHTTYYDLGVFQHALWDMAFNGHWEWIFYGHAHFFLPLDAVFYRIFPGGMALVLKQAVVIGMSGWLVGLTSADKDRGMALLAYALYFPIWYLALFDYHPEHLIIPFGLGFYAAAFRGKYKVAATCAICIALVKEPFALAGVFYGVYLVLRFRQIKSGLLCMLVCAAVFYVDKSVLIPAFTHDVGSEIYRPAYAWMGSSIAEVLRYLMTHPLAVMSEIISTPSKLVYLVVVFGALAFIPLASPMELIPAVPVLALSLLSKNENYYGIAHHYTSGLAAPMCAAFCLGLPRVRSLFNGRRNLPKCMVYGVVGCMAVVHFMIAPSPVSRLFLTDKVWGYGWESYFPAKRDEVIKAAVDKHVPSDPDVGVSASNTVVADRLVHRAMYEVFPRGVADKPVSPDWAGDGLPFSGPAAFVVLDMLRPWYSAGTGCRWRSREYPSSCPDNPWLGCASEDFQAEYLKEFEVFRERYTLLFEYDGFYIGKRESPAP